MPWPLLVLLMAIPSFLQFVRSTPINATDPVPSVVVVDPSDAIFPSSTSPDNTDLSPSSSDNMLPPQLDIASTSQDVGDEEGTTVTEPLEQYFWERVHPSNCPLNCSSSTLQCWRLAGYLLPFVCLPAAFDPNLPADSDANAHWWSVPMRWLLRASNAELVTLALLCVNTLLVLCTCLCVCARRKCLRKSY